MSKDPKQNRDLEIPDKEKDQLLEMFGKMDKQLLKATFEALTMFVRASEGRSVEQDDVISRLINVKNIVERSRFPTFPLIRFQVYLRLIAHYTPEAEPCERWANEEASALIAYKGENWKAYVEMVKGQALAAGAQQEFYFGKDKTSPEGSQPRRSWLWNRKSKEETEFRSQ
jgi:hypothetical protein